MKDSRRYKAFISYSHSDEQWARWLQRALEKYKLPKSLRKSYPDLPTRLYPIFRDRDELASGGDLSESIRAAMDDSDALVVICSPAARASRWVNEEIKRFRASGRGHRIFCLIVEGSPDPNSEKCAFPTTLLIDDIGETLHEPLAADATPGGDGKRNAMLKIAAGLLNVGVDDLKQRDAQRQARFWSGVAFGALFIAALTIGLAIYALNAKREAEIARSDSELRRQQAEGLIGFMLGDLRTKLEPIGKLELLESVGDQAMKYFASIGNLGSPKEMMSRAKALHQIGEVRMSKNKLESALQAFEQSLVQAKALHDVEPKNNDYLYELGQAEFWVGYVAWQRNELDQATISMQRYMQYSKELSDRAPDNQDYLLELSYAHGNLGSIALAQGRHLDALSENRAMVDINQTILAKSPDNSGYAQNVADGLSWIGSTLQELGRLHEAQSEYLKAANILKPFHLSGKDAPASAFYARMILFQAETHMRMGELQQAHMLIDEATGIHGYLVLKDPTNTIWKQQALTTELKQLSLIPLNKWNAETRTRQVSNETDIAALVKIDPSNLPFQISLMDNRRLAVLDLLAQGKFIDALQKAEIATTDWQTAIQGKTQTLKTLYSELLMQEVLGTTYVANGNQKKATEVWQACIKKLDGSKNPDPALLAIRRLLVLDLGQETTAKELKARLEKSEYKDPRMDPEFTLSGKFR